MYPVSVPFHERAPDGMKLESLEAVTDFGSRGDTDGPYLPGQEDRQSDRHKQTDHHRAKPHLYIPSGNFTESGRSQHLAPNLQIPQRRRAPAPLVDLSRSALDLDLDPKANGSSHVEFGQTGAGKEGRNGTGEAANGGGCNGDRDASRDGGSTEPSGAMCEGDGMEDVVAGENGRDLPVMRHVTQDMLIEGQQASQRERGQSQQGEDAMQTA